MQIFNNASRTLRLLVPRIVIVLSCLLASCLHARTETAIGKPSLSPIYTQSELLSFSDHFTGTPNPFHETVANLIARGATRQPAHIAQNLWRQGVGSSIIGGYHLPIYLGKVGQPTYVFSCVTYGKCSAGGRTVHLPLGASASADVDHHLLVFDTVARGEFDGWGGDGDEAHRCEIGKTRIACAWGGFFPFSGNGLDGNNGDSGNNGGFAFGLFVITAREILQGHIDHALGMTASCLDDPDVYPADTSKHTDNSCSNGINRGNPQYGQLFHLRDSYDVGASAYSPPCKVYLKALQKYGAYTYDTNNGYGIGIGIEDPTVYPSPNPWFTKILPEMERYGDGSGSAENFSFHSCLNRLSADDIEVFNIKPES